MTGKHSNCLRRQLRNYINANPGATLTEITTAFPNATQHTIRSRAASIRRDLGLSTFTEMQGTIIDIARRILSAESNLFGEEVVRQIIAELPDADFASALSTVKKVRKELGLHPMPDRADTTRRKHKQQGSLTAQIEEALAENNDLNARDLAAMFATEKPQTITAVAY